MSIHMKYGGPNNFAILATDEARGKDPEYRSRHAKTVFGFKLLKIHRTSRPERGLVWKTALCMKRGQGYWKKQKARDGI